MQLINLAPTIGKKRVMFFQTTTEEYRNDNMDLNIIDGDNKRNFRVTLKNIVDLAGKILLQGLLQPLLIWDKDGDYYLLQGFRRFAALKHLQEHEPVRFKLRFPDGIPVRVVSGILDKDAMMLMADHDRDSLSQYEVMLAFRKMKDAGHNEREIVCQFRKLLDTLYTTGKDAKARIAELDSMFEKAKTAREISIAQQDYRKYRHGLWQQFLAMYKLPDHYWDYYLKYNDTGKGFSITNSEVEKLGRAVIEDEKTVNGRNLKKYTRANPGPTYKLTFQSIIDGKERKKTDKDNGNEETRKKSIPAKEIKDEIDRFSSNGFRMLCQKHIGITTDMDELKDLDLLLLAAETLKAESPTIYKVFNDEVVRLNTLRLSDIDPTDTKTVLDDDGYYPFTETETE